MSETVRLPAHLEVSGLIRQVSAAGGFATVLTRGEPDAGTILLVLRHSRSNPRLFERMPHADGTRPWTLNRTQVDENKREFEDYLARRSLQDGDVWIVELDVSNPERFIGDSAAAG